MVGAAAGVLRGFFSQRQSLQSAISQGQFGVCQKCWKAPAGGQDMCVLTADLCSACRGIMTAKVLYARAATGF